MATIQIADKPTLDEVLAELSSSAYGLSVLKALLNTANTNAGDAKTYAKNVNDRLTAVRAGYLDYLANSAYGLSAIKTAVDQISAASSGGDLYPEGRDYYTYQTYSYAGYIKSPYGFQHVWEAKPVPISITGKGRIRFIASTYVKYSTESQADEFLGKYVTLVIDGHSVPMSEILDTAARWNEFSFGKSITVQCGYLPGSKVYVTSSTAAQPATPSSATSASTSKWLVYLS